MVAQELLAAWLGPCWNSEGKIQLKSIKEGWIHWFSPEETNVCSWNRSSE